MSLNSIHHYQLDTLLQMRGEGPPFRYPPPIKINERKNK